MKISKIIKSGFIIFIILFLISSVVGAGYTFSVYLDFVSNKNSIFKKIDQFSKDLNSNEESKIILGYERDDDGDEEAQNEKRVTLFLDRRGNTIAKYSHQRHRLIPLREIPYYLSMGFLLIEDQKFYSHFGINIRRFALGIINNIISLGRSPGG